nr:Gp15 family bacteriophage protein [uncultured Anaerocolumna sp.]
MIGYLPKQLNVNGVDRAIRSDFRTALLIFQACNDVELNDYEKVEVMIKCFFEDFEDIPLEDYQEANSQAVWFLEGGDSNTNRQSSKKIMDWEQDEQMIFSAVNKVAGCETREKEYLHWWTFLGYMREIKECLFSTVTNIREKKNKGKRLEKYEEEFYRENKNLIDIKVKYTEEEQAEIDYWNKLLG